MADGVAVRAGVTIHGPDGQAYHMTRDLCIGEAITPEHFEAIGGAPEMKEGEMIVGWLWAFLQNVAGQRMQSNA